ncbi:trypsin-3-like [Cimex lectularius]|uniref:Peptidase S1 domain-containing protein n=1 Tax=Cimex lectularius TaxID=79782 RepID=A0A8I6TKT9_CIMLE|nr:trypsin-3-like [Cimex lectularius]
MIFTVLFLMIVEFLTASEKNESVYSKEPSKLRKRLPASTAKGISIPTYGEYPYVVLIMEEQTEYHICEGAIISEIYVLTGCHCFTRYNMTIAFVKQKNEFLVVAGGQASWGLRDVKSMNSSLTQIRMIRKIHMHPKCLQTANNVWHYDFAFIRLKSGFYFNPFVTSFKRPSTDSETLISPKSNCVSLWWSRISHKFFKFSRLQAIKLKAMSKTACKQVLCSFDPSLCTPRDASHFICLRPEENYSGHCLKGGSAPLICKGRVHGILNWSPNCSSPQNVTVYSSLHPIYDLFDLYATQDANTLVPVATYELLLVLLVLYVYISSRK